jgi:NifU-like protein
MASKKINIMWEYNQKVKKLYQNPKNAGEIPNADGVGKAGSIICGDALKLYLKVNKKKNTITDAKFQTFGCGSAIASSSALTEIIKGKTISEAMKITNEDIIKYLGGLPKAKMHCSVMGYEALQDAIADYKGEKTKASKKQKIICSCFNVSEDKIRKTIKENNLKTVEEVTAYTKAGGNCGKCKPDIINILKDMKVYKSSKAEKNKSDSYPAFKKRIYATIDTLIKPALQKSGGNIEITRINRNMVTVKLKGACRGCAASQQTLKNFVEAKLKEEVSQNITVKEA